VSEFRNCHDNSNCDAQLGVAPLRAGQYFSVLFTHTCTHTHISWLVYAWQHW